MLDIVRQRQASHRQPCGILLTSQMRSLRETGHYCRHLTIHRVFVYNTKPRRPGAGDGVRSGGVRGGAVHRAGTRTPRTPALSWTSQRYLRGILTLPPISTGLPKSQTNLESLACSATKACSLCMAEVMRVLLCRRDSPVVEPCPVFRTFFM